MRNVTSKAEMSLQEGQLQNDKKRKIHSAMHTVDACERLEKLRLLAYEPHGFVCTELRHQVWPLLLEVDVKRCSMRESNEVLRDDSQLQKDIERSMCHYKEHKCLKEKDRNRKRKTLRRIIRTVLYNNEELYYYQGYHDIATIFYLVCKHPKSASLHLNQVSVTYFRDCMQSNFKMVMAVTKLLFPLIRDQDNELFQYIDQSKVEPYFAFPWIITWFAHHVDGLEIAERLYDVLLCSHPLFCLYISAALVCARREHVLTQECEFGAMHRALSSLARCMDDLDQIILEAMFMFEELPPEALLKRAMLQENIKESVYFVYPFKFQAQQSLLRRPLSNRFSNQRLRRRISRTARSFVQSLKSPTFIHAIALAGASVLLAYVFSLHRQFSSGDAISHT